MAGWKHHGDQRVQLGQRRTDRYGRESCRTCYTSVAPRRAGPSQHPENTSKVPGEFQVLPRSPTGQRSNQTLQRMPVRVGLQGEEYSLRVHTIQPNLAYTRCRHHGAPPSLTMEAVYPHLINCFSKFLILVPVANHDAGTVAQQLIKHVIT